MTLTHPGADGNISRFPGILCGRDEWRLSTEAV